MSSDRQRTRVKQFLWKWFTPSLEALLFAVLIFAPIYGLLLSWWMRVKSFFSR